MEKVNLKLDDAPLIVSALFPSAEVSITWLKQTSYVTPKLPKKLKDTYSEKMDWIMRQYQALQKQDELRAIAPHVLPYAAKIGLTLAATRQELLVSIPKLKGLQIDYTTQLANSLQDGLELENFVKETPVSDEAKGSLVRDRQRVRLVEAHPLNELAIISPELYERSARAWHDVLEEQENLSYNQKQLQLRALLDQRQPLNGIWYRFEIVAEPQLMREVQAKLPLSATYSQLPTPAHGYNVPKASDGGMIERCFDMSYELYSMLQSSKPELAPLTCLYGQRQRYLLEFDGQALRLLFSRKLKFSPPALNIIKFMRQEITLKHQTIGAWFDDKEKSSRQKSEASSSKD